MIGFVWLGLSAVALLVGAELFAENAFGAGRFLGMTTIAVGLILAGAEPEELVTAVIASARHHPGIAAGDAIGANVTMLTLIVGFACLVRPVPFGPRIRPYVWAASVAGLAAAVFVVGGVGRLEGGVLVALYAAIVALIWWRERTPPLIGELAEVAVAGVEAEGDRSPTVALVAVIAGVGLMVVGGRFAVAGAESVVRSLGLADSAVGLTFVALATTAELLALVWTAARHRVADLALAGILGSALYNATATLGAAALVHPIPSAGLTASAWMAAVLPLVLLAGARNQTLDRRLGALLVVSYAAFLVMVFALA